MQIAPIRCFERRCLRLKIVDFENTPITDLVHPETGEEVGGLQIVAYDAAGEPLGEHVYSKGSQTIGLCRMDRGWAYLEFRPHIRSTSRLLAANNVSEARRPSCRKGCHQNAQGPFGWFLAEIRRNNVSSLLAGAT